MRCHSNSFFILGAADPEMNEIRRLLQRLELPFAWASNGGRKTSWGTAYQADGICDDWGAPVVGPASGQDIVWVECGGASLQALFGTPVARADHHRLGDPGHGAEPGDAWPACSLAQVMAMARGFSGYRYDPVGDSWEGLSALSGSAEGIERHLVMMGSADHNLPAAFAGRCPGVNPEDLVRFRNRMLADNNRVSTEQYARWVDDAIQVIMDSPELTSGVKDLRALGFVEALAEAAARQGVAVLSESEERIGSSKILTGRRKWCLMGSTGPAPVEWFLQTMVPEQGLTGAYGDPARGFAGAYLPDHLAAEGFERDAIQRPEDPRTGERKKWAQKLIAGTAA